MGVVKKTVTCAALAACVLLLFSAVFCPSARVRAAAFSPDGENAAVGAYDYTVTQYDVAIQIRRDRTVEVQETFRVDFSGRDSHGVIRDLPLGDGVRYAAVEAACLDSDDFSPYVRTEDADDGTSFLSVYLRGRGGVTGQTRTYRLSYRMAVPATREEGYLPLDVVGYGMTGLNNVTASVTFPDGLLDYKIYSGATIASSRSGNTLLMETDEIPFGGITLDLRFGEGVLTTNFDYGMLGAAGVGAAALLAVFLIKLFFCREPLMTATVNFEAPEEMDPLLMGKLIDNKVDNEDLGAAVFYLADRGYLTIDLDDERDPLLTRTEKAPVDLPPHIRKIYDGLFDRRDSVRPSALSNSFYRTAQAAIGAVGAVAGEIYRPSSKALIGVAGALTVLLTGGFVFLYCLFGVFRGYFYWQAALLSLLSFAIACAMGCTAKQRDKKWSAGKRFLLSAAGVLCGALPCLLCVFFPCAAFGFLSFLLLCLFSSLCGAVAGGYLTRTEEHAKRLGQIIGFRQFITVTERDKIEFMLKENPQLYYHILPYAQVLGVTDAWTDKFKGLEMRPPAYAVYGSPDLFDVLLFHHMFRTINANLCRTMVSRPSSSGGGGHSGSFGGGFGGGGFGGGGMRGC